MVDKDELRDFLRFLDTASDKEIGEREVHYQELLGILPAGSDVRRDVQFLKRKLIEEKLARINLRFVRERRKARQS